MRLALCQIGTQEWESDANVERTLAALEAAADAGADLALTPECVFHGYGFDAEALRARLLAAAEPLDGARLAAVRALARRRRMDIVVGFAERAGETLHNSAAFITAEGETAFVYRKVHCRAFEAAWGEGAFEPGAEFFVAERPGGRIGVMICFDREVAESVRCLRARGAELIVCPLATGTSDLLHPGARADNELVTRVRAAENEVAIAVVNHAAPRFNGGSFVVGPRGEPLVQLGPDPEVRVVEIDLEAVRALHSAPLGWMGWGYRRPALYRPYLDPQP